MKYEVMKYEDFVIEVNAIDGKGYMLRVANSPGGQSQDVPFAPPYALDKLETELAHLARNVRHSAPRGQRVGVEDTHGNPPTSDEPREIGQQLFDALFRDQIRRLYDSSRAVLPAKTGLRILLKLKSHNPALARFYALPWEFLRDPDASDDLSLTRQTPVVRYLEAPRTTPAPAPWLWTLRILVVMANPKGSSPLGLKREKRLLTDASKQQRGIELEFLENATFENLREKLREKTFHALHFMGHGRFNENGRVGELLFEAEDKTPDARSGEALATELKSFRSLRLVFLNACDTTHAMGPGGLNPFTGVATALVMGGLPAVVAMQFQISDEAAIAFSNSFYRHLAHGAPIDVAVTEGRLAVYHENDRTMEWGTPVLFSRISDGRLFQTLTRRALLVAAGGGLLLASGTGWTFYHLYCRSRPRPSLAVFPFTNTSGKDRDAWLATALSETLAASLRADGKLRVLKGERIHRILNEPFLAAKKKFTERDFANLQENLGYEYLVFGSYRLNGTSLGIDWHLWDIENEISSASRTFNGVELVRFGLQARHELQPYLNLTPLTKLQESQLEATLPLHPNAFRPYFEGLHLNRQFKLKEAIKQIEQAKKHSPEHALSYALLAKVRFNAGYAAVALREARIADSLSKPLSNVQIREIHALYLEFRTTQQEPRDGEEMIKAYRSLFEDYPDEPEYGDNLARVQINAGRAQEALKTLETLRRSSDTSFLPWVDLRAASAYFALGDPSAAYHAADQAAQQGESRLLVAQAQLERARALDQLHAGREKAKEALSEAQELFAKVDDPLGEAEVKEMSGAFAFESGDITGARELYEECLAKYRITGYTSRQAGALTLIASTFSQQNNYLKAAEFYGAALAIVKELGDRSQEEFLLREKGASLHFQGEITTAHSYYLEAQDVAEELGDQEALAWILTSVAEIYYLRGDLDAAKDQHQDALHRMERIGDKSGTQYNIFRLAKLDATRGLLADARERFQTLLSEQDLAEDTLAAAETRIELARVVLALEDIDEAMRLANEAAAVLREQSIDDLAALAQVVAVEAKLRHGDLDLTTAFKNLDEIVSHLPGDTLAGLRARLAAAEIAAAYGRDGATEQIKDIQSRAIAKGILFLDDRPGQGASPVAADQIERLPVSKPSLKSNP